MKPEEKLLRAIYGEPRETPPEICHYEKCRKIVYDPIYYNGKPYHPTCLSKEMEK